MAGVRATLVCVVMAGCALGSPSADAVPLFLTKWGQPGGGAPGLFFHPTGVVASPGGSVLVSDTYNNRIQRFTPSGEFVGEWGSSGSGDGQLNSPWGLAVDKDGHVYVADYDNHRIQKFSANGTFLAGWGSWGTDAGQFDHPWDVALDPTGQFAYVADRFNSRIQKFSAAGEFILQWGNRDDGSPGRLTQPSGIAVGPSGSVYVIDASYRVRKFTPDGVLLREWGGPGAAQGRFYGQDDVAIDAAENIYVADDENARVQQFTSNGDFVRAWGSECRLYVDRGGCIGDGDGQLFQPKGIAVDGEGNIYVTEFGNHRVQKFGEQPVSTRRTTWGAIKDFYR